MKEKHCTSLVISYFSRKNVCNASLETTLFQLYFTMLWNRSKPRRKKATEFICKTFPWGMQSKIQH